MQRVEARQKLGTQEQVAPACAQHLGVHTQLLQLCETRAHHGVGKTSQRRLMGDSAPRACYGVRGPSCSIWQRHTWAAAQRQI